MQKLLRMARTRANLIGILLAALTLSPNARCKQPENLPAKVELPVELTTQLGFGAQGYSSFGRSVSNIGDVNGDSFDDLLVGASEFDYPANEEGAAFVYYGSANGFASTPSLMLEANQDAALYGWTVGSAGDLNGDGLKDIYVGALFFDLGQEDEGAVFIYFGGAGAMDANPDAVLQQNIPEGYAAFASGVSDFNGDGFDDISVALPNYSNGEADEGAILVYYGGAQFDSVPDLTLEGNEAGAQLSGAGTLGDVNMDGFIDIALFSSMGTAIYYGSAAGFESTIDISVIGKFAGNAGDLNGDGIDDLAVGNPSEAEVDIFLSPHATIELNPDQTLKNIEQPESGFGRFAHGDFDGDGFDDLAVGAPYYNNDGTVILFRGGANGLIEEPAAQLLPEPEGLFSFLGAHFGTDMAVFGDQNADGRDELVVGASFYRDGMGAALWYHDAIDHPLRANHLHTVPFQVFSASENLPVGSIVGTVQVSDQDVDQAYSFTLGGMPAFAIDSISGEISVATSLDASQSPHHLYVYVSDGFGVTQFGQIRIDVVAAPLPPTALVDSYATTVGVPLVVPAPGILSNDLPGNAVPMTASVESLPAGGILSLESDGEFTFTPNVGFVGSTSFTYKATSPAGTSNTTTVSIDVLPNTIFRDGF